MHYNKANDILGECKRTINIMHSSDKIYFLPSRNLWYSFSCLFLLLVEEIIDDTLTVSMYLSLTSIYFIRRYMD